MIPKYNINAWFNFIDNMDTCVVILQSHYPNRRLPDGRWAKNRKIGRRRPMVGRRRHRFWYIFRSADDFFVEAAKLKVSLNDPPILQGFVIGEVSGDGRPLIGRQSADILKILSSWYRPKVARSSGVVATLNVKITLNVKMFTLKLYCRYLYTRPCMINHI